jgi:hypothetical protein
MTWMEYVESMRNVYNIFTRKAEEKIPLKEAEYDIITHLQETL